MSEKNKSLIARLSTKAELLSETIEPKAEAPPQDKTRRPLRTPGKISEAEVTTTNVNRAGHNDELTVFIVAGEHSGDVLGADLMRELTRRRKGQIRFIGVGGEGMQAQGLTSLFPLADIAVMGPLAILKALPRLINRVNRTAHAGLVAKPDVVIIIDSPEFTHPVAKRIKRRLPNTPVIDYVCPSVWAWRPGRARKMTRYVDHVLALLPFEPAALERLNGPPATYVGHPLSARKAWIDGIDTDAWRARFKLDPKRVPLVVLPGSRRSEVELLMPVFGEAIAKLHASGHRCDLLMPCVPHLQDRIKELSNAWPMPRHYIEGDEQKFAAFRLARAALAASGTVTLELGVAGTPMIVTYLVDGFAAKLRFLLKVPSVVLANLVLDENAFPELLQEECNPDAIAKALVQLLDETPERAAQIAALERLAIKMKPGDQSASERAADVVMNSVQQPR